jgi:hypothetical protein
MKTKKNGVSVTNESPKLVITPEIGKLPKLRTGVRAGEAHHRRCQKCCGGHGGGP